jgi:methyl-accepting chemotaxis protein
VSGRLTRAADRGPFTTVANQINSGSDQVASAAAQVSSSAQALAQGAAEQASAVEETSASSMNVRAMTERNGNNARNVGRTDGGSRTNRRGHIARSNSSAEEAAAAAEELTAQAEALRNTVTDLNRLIGVTDRGCTPRGVMHPKTRMRN